MRRHVPRYLVFRLDEQQTVRMVDLGEAEAIDDSIASLRAEFVGRGRDLSPDPAVYAGAPGGELLRRAVFDPLRLEGHARL